MNVGSKDLSCQPIGGILNIDKPAGMTSHDVVARVRRWTGQRKVGHAGTLDPMATGVLLVCVGKATRVAEYLVAGRKEYRAVIRLGVSTATYDAEGTVVRTVEGFSLSQSDIAEALAAFQGVIQQAPPPYSALRQGGRRLYELARRGIAVQVPPRKVEIEAIELVAWDYPHLTLDVICSPGTYIRSLAHDLGQALQVGGHVAALTRLASGHWRLSDAVSLASVQCAADAGHWTDLLNPVDAALQDFERVDLPAEWISRVGQGQPIRLDPQPETPLARAYGPDGSLVALLRPAREPGTWRPAKFLINSHSQVRA